MSSLVLEAHLFHYNEEQTDVFFATFDVWLGEMLEKGVLVKDSRKKWDYYLLTDVGERWLIMRELEND